MLKKSCCREASKFGLDRIAKQKRLERELKAGTATSEWPLVELGCIGLSLDDVVTSTPAPFQRSGCCTGQGQ